MHMGNYKVAVITTIYKSDKIDLFELSLSSITEQSGIKPPRIYLFIDGPLPESHRLFIESNRHKFYKISESNVNVGLAVGLNKLIDLLEDEDYIFRMDGDDVSHPYRFIKQISYLNDNPQISLCGSQVIDIDANGSEVGVRNYPTSTDSCEAILGRILPILHPTFCFKRSVFNNPSIRYPVSHLSEDLGFIIIFIENGYKFSNHPEALFYFRTDKGFYKRRRDFKRGWLEMKWFYRYIRMKGSLASIDSIYPPARFILRILPVGILKVIYESPIRRVLISR